MHYGEMPRATLGLSDLRSQVAIFGEWNIYGTRKILLLNFKPVTRIWKKLSSDKKLKNNKKTNCPKFIDIQWNKRRNKVGTIRAWRHVILSFIHQRQCFVSHSNDMTSWQRNLAKNVSCNVVTSCLLWRHRWMRFYTMLIYRTLAFEGGGLKSLKIGSLEK